MKFRNHHVYVFVDLFYRACLPTHGCQILLGNDGELVGGLWPSPKNTIAISTNHHLSIVEHNTMWGSRSIAELVNITTITRIYGGTYLNLDGVINRQTIM